MKIATILVPLASCVLALPLLAQPQVGGGTCNSSTLDGAYSLTLSGRTTGNSSSEALFSGVLQGVGTITFDGLSKVTAVLTENTNTSAAALNGSGGITIGAGPNPTQLSGTYSVQANCLGTVSITSGDTATFTLGVYNLGTDFFITGEDGTYSFTGSGNTMPTAACSNSTLNGSYSFNGNGFGLSSSHFDGAGYFSGVLVFDGAGNVTGNWFGTSGNPPTVSLTGTYTVAAGCTGTATIKDNSGNSYAVALTITASSGAFIMNAADSILMLIASGRPL